MRAPKILVFDSGLGGLTVHDEIVKLRPHAHYLYLADDAAFPYGRLSEAQVIARVGEVIAHAIAAENPDIIVIACNTASTLVLPHLRARVKGISAGPAHGPCRGCGRGERREGGDAAMREDPTGGCGEP